MPNLLTTYANACGLEINDMEVHDVFYPLQEGAYITIQGKSSQQTKDYDYLDEVIDVIYPILAQNKIRLIQIGAKDDVALKNCEHLQGKTTIRQALYVVKNAVAHLGVDSFAAHYAGFLAKPIVVLYGNTDKGVHGPHWQHALQTRLLESHRNGRTPSFGQESPKTVNFIKVEDFVNAILEIFNVPQKYNRKSLYISENYNQKMLEYIPNFKLDHSQLPGSNLIVRMDYHFDEANLAHVAESRNINIFTNKAINLDLLFKIKGKVNSLNFEVSQAIDPEYIKQLKKTAIKTAYFSREEDPATLAKLRLKFFDICPIIQHKNKTYEEFLNDASNYLNISKEQLLAEIYNSPNLLYRSNKFIISEGKVFLSKAAWKANEQAQSFEHNIQPIGKKIVSPDFWEEFQHFYIFNEPTNS